MLFFCIFRTGSDSDFGNRCNPTFSRNQVFPDGSDKLSSRGGFFTNWPGQLLQRLEDLSSFLVRRLDFQRSDPHQFLLAAVVVPAVELFTLRNPEDYVRIEFLFHLL